MWYLGFVIEYQLTRKETTKGNDEMKLFFRSRNAASAAAIILIAVMSLTGCKGSDSKKNTMDPSNEVSSSSDTSDSTDAVSGKNSDIDLDSLNESVEAIKNLTFDTDVSTDSDNNDTENDTAKADDPSENTKTEPSGVKTVYSFTDVYADGNDLTVIPNGGLNPQTVLHAGKDLKGFLDYVDSDVLEKGRTINRDFFYDMLAVMLVDKNLSSDEDTIEKDLIMALAMANNFHDMDVKINDCYLNAANAAEYKYHITAYGKDDTWIVNYRDRTMYMNDGKTEYVSEMFKDEYLAVWMVAIEDYYGIVFK